MKVAQKVGEVNGYPIWKHTMKDGDYLVREFGFSKIGCRNYIIQSPSEELYCFSNYERTLEELFHFIQKGSAEREPYKCNIDSIFDDKQL